MTTTVEKTEEPFEPPFQIMTDASGRVRDFDQVYDAWFSPYRRPKHVARGILEASGFMTIGLLYYWLDPLANSADWDDPTLAWRLNLTNSLRFDTNLNTTNHLLHPMAGALVYGTGRVNGWGVLPSFAMVATSSFLWEMALEWREKPSINDLIYTSIGGAALGEFGNQLGEYLNSAPNNGSMATSIAGSVLGAPRAIHHAIDRDPAPRERLPPDNLGLSSAYTHDFRLLYSIGEVSNEQGTRGMLQRARIMASIVAMPGFLLPGRFSRTFENGNFTEFDLKLGWGETGFDEADLQTRATFFGHYAQNIHAEGDGHASMIGVGSGLRFNALEWNGRHDQLSTIHLIGPQASVWLTDSSVRLQLAGEVMPDFASFDSLAYLPYIAQYGSTGLKTVLQRQGYQFSLGISARARAVLDIGPFTLTGSASRGSYATIEGRDRFQEDISRDIHGTEALTELEAGAYARLPVLPIVVGVNAYERLRTSSLAEVVVHRRERYANLTMGIAF